MATHRYSIDLHCHTFTPAVEQLVGADPRRQAEQARMDRAQGPASVAHNRGMLAGIAPKLMDVGLRLADMDAAGIDVQVVSPAPTQYCYWAEPALAEQLVDLQNERVAALVRQAPERLAGLGTVALQHPQMALRQLEHAVNGLGLRGVQLCTSIEGGSLADPALEPFWQRAAELECVLLLHPMGCDFGERLARHYLWNVIGQPLETTVALSELILSGLLDRLPGLRLCSCHGGGYLSHCAGRIDHAWRVRPEARCTPQPPSHYLRRIWHDCLVHSPQQLRHLIDCVGADRVVLGSDYPFDMGDERLHALIDAVPGLGAAERDALCHGNAQGLLSRGGRPFVPGLNP